jgi:hypothetical protein
MAHFAKIDSNGIVVDVIVVNNDVLLENGIENEQKGKDFIQGLFGSGTWVQTSYNGSIRKNYAGIGYTYNSDKDAFIPPKPYSSWTLNETTCLWEAPVDHPTDGSVCEWDEEKQQWINCTTPPEI